MAGKIAVASGTSPMSLPLARAYGDGGGKHQGGTDRHGIAEEIAALQPVLNDQPDTEDHHGHRYQRGVGRALLEEDPGEDGGEHRGEGDDEDDVGCRGIEDGQQEGEGTEAVEQACQEPGLAGHQRDLAAENLVEHSPGDQCDDERAEAAHRQQRPDLAIGGADQWNVEGKGKAAKTGDEKTAAVVGGIDGFTQDFVLSGGGTLSCIALPALGHKVLLRQKLCFIIHFARSLDPVAKIDVRQPAFLHLADVIEDHEDAKRTVGEFRIEIGIDHRQAIAHLVGQCRRDQRSLRLCRWCRLRP